MRNNNQTNQLIQWVVTIGDFLLLNAIILLAAKLYWRVDTWPERSLEIFVLVNNVALMLSQIRFSNIIHLRMIGAGDVVQRLVGLTMFQTALTYVLLKIFDYYLPIGWMLLGIGTVFFITLTFKRIIERWFVRLYRTAGRNTRAVTLVGSDCELLEIYKKLFNDSTLGYKILVMKIQSLGPLFFRQKRTGLDGKDFEMLKFRSMHVNKDADKIQATKNDPRKYPFGNFMRKSNIDELPQFLNVLKGDMSIVGPRPHYLDDNEDILCSRQKRILI